MTSGDWPRDARDRARTTAAGWALLGGGVGVVGAVFLPWVRMHSGSLGPAATGLGLAIVIAGRTLAVAAVAVVVSLTGLAAALGPPACRATW